MLTRVVAMVAVLVATAQADPYRCKPAPPPAPTAELAAWPVLAQLLPAPTTCVDGEVIGVLAAYTGKLASPSGPNVEPLAPHQDAWFEIMVPGASARVVWFAQDGSAEKLVFDAEGKPYSAGADRVLAADRTRVGLRKDAHLVRLEINGGRGAGTNRYEVVGKVLEVLDGTQAYPLDVSKLLRTTLASFEQATHKRGARWRTLARKAAADAIKADTATNLKPYKRGEQLAGGYFARWLPASKTLRITFYGRLTATYSRKLKTPPSCPDPRASADVPCVEPPRPAYFTEQRAYPTEYAFEIDFDATGKQVATKEYPAAAAAPTTTNVY